MVGVKATSYMIKPKSSGFEFSHNLGRMKVMSCVQYIKDKLGGEYQKILLKLLDDNKLSNKELEWFGDSKKVGKLSTIVNEFYNLWNKG